MKLPSAPKNLPKSPGKLPMSPKSEVQSKSTLSKSELPKSTVKTSLPVLKKTSLPVSLTDKSLPISHKKSSLPKSPTKKSLPTLKKTEKTSLPMSPKSPKKSSLPMSPKKSSLPKSPDSKDPRKYIDTFFGTRNNIKGNPIENINYTLETLTYMTSKNRADQITRVITDRITGPFQVYECCGGIGGNTMSFLDNNRISHVTVFETDPDRVKMLKNNLSMYKLDKKSTFINAGFSGVPDEKNNKQVMFFDPPWTLPSVKGHESTKEDYLLQGIKLGDKTLEEWVKSCPHCEMTLFKVPIGYKLKEIPGYNKEEIVFKNSQLIIVKPDVSLKHQEKLKIKKEKEHKEYIIWRNNLKSFLRNEILPKVVGSPAALDKLVSDEAMKIWEVAFTNESFAPNVGENYEELELSGDVNLAAAYVKFMMASYPEITRSQLSEFRTKYLAKGFQSQLSASLGFGSHIRSRFKTNTHVLEDVLESFFGALDLIADQEFKFGSGGGLVYNMVVELYKDVEVDWVVALGNSKTRIKEYYEGLSWIFSKPPYKEKVPDQIIENEDGSVTFSILVPKTGMDYLKSIGKSLDSNVISRATGNTKKIAEKKAYDIALQNLNNLGITDEFLKIFKMNKDLQNNELKPYFDSIQNRLNLEGYVKFYLTEHHVNSKPGMAQKTSKYIQLIGVDKNGRKEILSMTAEPVADVLEGKKYVLRKYENYE